MKIFCSILLMTVVFERGMAAEECNEEELKKCLSTLEHLLMNQFEGIKKGEKDLTGYCQTLEREGQCLKEASMSCKKEHPIVSNLVTTFHDYLNQFCNEDAKMYMDIAPCFETHKAAFEKCFSGSNPKRDADEDHLQDICKEMKSMECVAQLSKEKCKNGEAFGKALDERIKHLKSDVCSSASSAVSSFWGMLVIVFAVIFIRNKQ